ncbi:mechanosensitive ion channel family protein [Agrobacterium rhizogenes]|nr:mechanosensitive ion channel family protein [Rhizobium rhizogenes]NTG56143.1 mechanosensitive ion channel family protein [Rhizobium rhizogenes]NTH01815.1 mechanosensitive ion channel family protein [Rhizobium rhizogenes]NTI57526.1 mechanosensitive ion channel family protein [Rhizobium rhizogenes]
MRWLALGLFLFCMSVSANAQTSRPQKVDELVQLLRDPDVKSWLEKQAPSATPAPDVGSKDYLSAWEAATRSRVDDILAAFPGIPGQLAEAFSRTRQDAISHGFAPVLIILVGLIAIGAVAERLFARQWRANPSDLAAARLLPLAVFATVMAIVFFAVEWPALVRMVLLVLLLALVAYRIVSALISMAGPPPSILWRARFFVAVLILAVASASLGAPLSVDPTVTLAISWCFSIALLLLAVEAVWTTAAKPLRTKVALTVFLLAIWLLWCLGLKGLFWLGVYALALPAIVRTVGHAAEVMFPSRPDSTRHVLVGHGSRSLVILLAVAWLSLVWRLDPNSLTRMDPAVGAIAHGLLKSVIILLGADIIWHLARSWIDRTLAIQEDTLPADETARRARLHTLLPIFRNVLAVLVIVMAALIILSELGVKIGPLLAGAGIFGVALGFGSQTLVKDVISGVFYMLDDAFRVGEYIQAKSYKGTVEGFSLRSVRLRHHRGPVFTVPFGELGAVENLSRDWAIDKFKISVGYNTDIDKARKILKEIGATLLADPELGPLFIQPLKMKGVEEFGDYGMVLSFAMTTVPGQQTFIRRKAYAMIRDAFQKNGIDFAQPSVQVGDDKTAAAAATAIKVSAEAKLPVAEG